MEQFGEELRRLRLAAGFSGLRKLAERTGYDYGYLGQIERGTRRPSRDLAEACDTAVGANGELLAIFHGKQEANMRRRSLLGTLTGLAASTSISPMISLEALRQAIGTTADADHDEWQVIAAGYEADFYQNDVGLLPRLQTDLLILQQLMTAQPEDRDLARSAAQMSYVMAVVLTGTGDSHAARRWWATARKVADRSGDLDIQLLIRAKEAVDGLYAGRPLGWVLHRADETIALAGNRVCTGTASALAGRAQALAMAGDKRAAIAAVQHVEEVTERMPASAVAQIESLAGWPEHRLRHTQSYVFSRTGMVKQATVAQDRAVALYPESQARLRTQVEMHRASCMIQDGHISSGLRYAAEKLDTLPEGRRNEMLYEMVRMVARTVPEREQERPEYDELKARLPHRLES